MLYSLTKNAGTPFPMPSTPGPFLGVVESGVGVLDTDVADVVGGNDVGMDPFMGRGASWVVGGREMAGADDAVVFGAPEAASGVGGMAPLEVMDDVLEAVAKGGRRECIG
jgi:hypothetical protein